MRADRQTTWYSILVRMAPMMALVAVLFVPRVAAAAPSISLDPDSGPRGADVTVTGKGFPGGALVTVTWDGLEPLHIGGVDRNGSFTAQISVPALASEGPHTVTATALTQSASASFVVQVENTTTAPTSTTISTTTTSSTTSSTTSTTTSTTSTTTPPDDSTTTTTRPASEDSSTDTTAGTGNGAPGSANPGEVGDGAPPTTTRSGDGGATTSTAAEGPPGPTAATDPSTTTSTTGTAGGGLELAGWAGAELGSFPVLAAAGQDLPHLDGLSLAPGSLSVHPSAAYTGAAVDISLDMDVPTGGFFTLVLLLDGTPLGDPVPLVGSQITVTRAVPAMTPGSYTMAAIASDLVLAQAPFDVLDSGTEAKSPEWLFLGIVVAALIALGWQTVLILTSPTHPDRHLRGRMQRGDDPPK